jgi:hypothetical protein
MEGDETIGCGGGLKLFEMVHTISPIQSSLPPRRIKPRVLAKRKDFPFHEPITSRFASGVLGFSSQRIHPLLIPAHPTPTPHHILNSNMACIASTFTGSVAALKASKVTVRAARVTPRLSPRVRDAFGVREIAPSRFLDGRSTSAVPPVERAPRVSLLGTDATCLELDVHRRISRLGPCTTDGDLTPPTIGTGNIPRSRVFPTRATFFRKPSLSNLPDPPPPNTDQVRLHHDQG